MCRFFVMEEPLDIIAERYEVEVVSLQYPRQWYKGYNIVPECEAQIIGRFDADRKLRMEPMRWGLIASFAQSKQSEFATYNARAEGLLASKLYGPILRKQKRCLFPVSRFYEVYKSKGAQYPYSFRARDGEPFAIAGLWERNALIDTTPIYSATMITVAANDLVKKIHPRMPAVLTREQARAWLDPAVVDPEVLMPLLAPCPADFLEQQRASPYLLHPERFDGPWLLDPNGKPNYAPR